MWTVVRTGPRRPGALVARVGDHRPVVVRAGLDPGAVEVARLREDVKAEFDSAAFGRDHLRATEQRGDVQRQAKHRVANGLNGFDAVAVGAFRRD